MRAKGYFYRIMQHPEIPALDQQLVLYLLQFAAFRPYELWDQPAVLESAPLLARSRTLIRMMLRCRTNPTTWSVLYVDLDQLVLYHLVHPRNCKDRRIDAAVETIRGWGMGKGWGEGESMEDVPFAVEG